MVINQNHTFDDLEGVKCAIVEKNCKPERVEFLKNLLEFNHFAVVIAKSPQPKAAAPVAINPDAPPVPLPPPPPETFTLCVTDVAFNATNAIFGRLLHTPDGHVVTLKYWQQKENVAHDDLPYFAKK
jgi:hypothetical protein